MTAVIFDLDGTLIDSQRAITASLHRVQREAGLEYSDAADLRWALGPPLAEIFGRLLNSKDPARIARAIALYRAHHTSVCLMVGDRDHDVIGARANGISCIAVNYGYGSREEVTAAGPDAICESPAELVDALVMIFKGDVRLT